MKRSLEVGGHFGLLGMRERAERLGGELQLHSEPGQGTEVEVTVPLLDDQTDDIPSVS